MRRRLSIVLVALVALVAGGCASAGSNDPYQLVFSAQTATWQQVQVDLGASFHMGTASVTLDPGAVRVVVDTKAHKGLLHVSIPTSALGPSASGLGQLGVTGNTLDLDVLYDGTALYAKSPLAPALIHAAFANSPSMPTGDLTGWLQLASASELASLQALGGSIASAAPEATYADANAMKSALAAKGVTLAFVKTESKNGVDADHVSATIDWDKLAADPTIAKGVSAAQVQQAITALKDYNPTIDLWLDHTAHRLVGVEVKGASAKDATQTFDLTVAFKAPDAGISLDTPASSVAVPMMQMLTPMLQQMMSGMH